jgi:DNA-binding transcriptional LysR family regulator
MDLDNAVNLYRLYVFHLVGKQMSFSGAAEALHTSQPNISRHIQKLEKELGVLLFERPGGRVTLTEAGRVVYDYSERIFGMVEEMRRTLEDLEGLERGNLRLGASSTPGLYVLPPLMTSFWNQYPGLEIALELSNSQRIVEKVLAGQLDLGFVEGFETVPGLQSQPFLKDQLVWIASRDHWLAGKGTVTVKDLHAETILWREKGSSTRQVMENLLGQPGGKPSRYLELQGCESVKQGVIANLGMSLVSLRTIDLEMSQDRLVILDVPELSAERAINMIVRKDRRLSVAALAFWAHLRKTAS